MTGENTLRFDGSTAAPAIVPAYAMRRKQLRGQGAERDSQVGPYSGCCNRYCDRRDTRVPWICCGACQDRCSQHADRFARRSRTVHRQRPEHRARGDQSGRRCAGTQTGTEHGGQRRHESRHGARLLQAVQRSGHRCDRRTHREHSDPGCLACHRRSGHPDHDRGHRSQPHAREQPLGIPCASQRSFTHRRSSRTSA